MNLPEDLKYTKEHEWIRVSGNIATVGITDYAQDQLGEVVFVELPDEGEEFSKDDAFGSVESVKSVNDIYSPVSGKIIEVNDPVADSPEIVNDDPFGEGWLVKIELENNAELKELLSAKDYKKYIEEEND